MRIRIMIDGKEWQPSEKPVIAVAVDMWYDRHRREWVLYPIDDEGNQLAEALYGFSKAEAKALKQQLEAEWIGKEVER